MFNHTLVNYCIVLKAKGHSFFEKAKGHSDLGDVNTTSMTLSKCAKDLWMSDRVTMIRIEVFVVLTAICLLFIATFGSWRRRSRNFFIQRGVLGAYTLSSSLLLYTLGSMHSSAVQSGLYPIWAASLYVLFGCVDSITAFSVNDNNKQTDQLFLLLALQAYTYILIRPGGLVVRFYLLQLASFQFMQRFWAYNLASRSWNLNKMVADYMYEEHSRSGPSYDPISMKGYRYLVDWPLDEPKLQADGMLYARGLTVDGAQVIDMERIWLCSGVSPEMKDVCLSFSLFNLLRRRFFGFACAESSQPKTHDFVFKGLLSKNENGDVDYNRAFKVIDVELAFMYDFFFTKYVVLYYGSKKVSTIWSLASASLISVTAYQVAQGISYDQNGSDFMPAETADVVITVLILSCIALLEFLQVLLYWSTIWNRVYFVCSYVREQAVNSRGSICTKHFLKICCMRFREIILTKIVGASTSRSGRCYYQNKLGQYSLLESVSKKYNHNPRNKSRFRWFMKRICCLYLPPDFEHLCSRNIDTINARYIRKGHGKPAAVKLPAEVKKALVHSLQRTQGVLANGELSLVYNRVHDLLWACKHNMLSHSEMSCYQGKENQTHIILTWHIATSYCEMATLKCLCPRVGGELKLHLDVATILSKYCAYLVVSAPKLLPGHHYDTRLVFDAVAVEAAQFLRKSKDKHEAMKRLPESTETSIFRTGVKLGRQLEEIEDVKRWKVLADFWAEMLLYLAPSDNVNEHVQWLANGGEFLTHLWALLTHAGILNRDQRNVFDIENAEVSEQPSPGQGSPYSSPCTTRAALATYATNQSATTSGNHTYCRPAVQPAGTMVRQQADSVQNVEGMPNAITAPRPKDSGEDEIFYLHPRKHSENPDGRWC